jgi:hypothetical protein
MKTWYDKMSGFVIKFTNKNFWAVTLFKTVGWLLPEDIGATPA